MSILVYVFPKNCETLTSFIPETLDALMTSLSEGNGVRA